MQEENNHQREIFGKTSDLSFVSKNVSVYVMFCSFLFGMLYTEIIVF